MSLDAVKLREHYNGAYLPSSMLVHCNNYFTYICENTNNLIRGLVPANPQQIEVFAKAKLPDARKVKSLLDDTKQLLKDNSSKWWPK